jgi:hypothetical protein
VFHGLPTPAARLACVEAGFAILSEQGLQRAALPAVDAAQRALTDFIATHDAHPAHPFTWRTGVRCYQRRTDKLAAPTQAAA